MTRSFSGEGPGLQTADGCSVELYRLLSYRGELEDMKPLLKRGSRVLELGCGTGRITRRLLELGCQVTAIDNSPAMLEEVPEEAVRVTSDIEELQLQATFDVVVLASYLINHPAASVRSAFMEAARRHSAKGTNFLVERHSPDWINTVQVGPLGISDGVALHVESLVRKVDTVAMTLRYETRSSAWRQSFSMVALSKDSIERILHEKGFGSFTWFGEQSRWVNAVFQ